VPRPGPAGEPALLNAAAPATIPARRRNLSLLTLQCHSGSVSAEGWTIDELAQRVTATLAEQGVQAPSGRVTAVPDRRLIRWYATIGLLDRPLRTRGRVARYGQRHLLQLVAVKRRQAEGRTLAEIQAELAGATDAILRRAAGLPDPAAERLALAAPTDDRDGFWRTLPSTSPVPPPPVSPVYQVRLHDTATLVLHAAPTPDDLAAIHAAARPLLDLLAARGLLPEAAPDTVHEPSPNTWRPR
jgi:hypothetical protein